MRRGDPPEVKFSRALLRDRGRGADIDKVMADQADLVEPVHVLKQVLCVKGA